MNKKRTVAVLLVFLIAILIAFFVSTGFTKRSDIWLTNYNVSADGSSITIKVAVASSMGYIRDCQIEKNGDNKYLTFYSCFGGLNSSIGAKNEFTIDIEPSTKEIYFYSADSGNTLVLQKNATTNEWEKAIG